MEEETLELTLVIVGLIVLGSALLAYYYMSVPDAGANVAELSKCRPQGGYTEQEWREHMEHHPLAYQECLKRP